MHNELQDLNIEHAKAAGFTGVPKSRRGTFTPFIASCDAIFDVEAEHYLKRLNSHLADKWVQ